MPSPEDSIASVLIVGAGWNGRQVAAQCVAHGIDTYLADIDPQALEISQTWIGRHIQIQVDEQLWARDALRYAADRLRLVQLDQSAPTHVDLVIECVLEQITSKRRVLRELSGRYSEPTIIASNSSYFVPSMLTRFVSQPQRFAHLHFHSPVWRATIVDIVPGPETDPAIVSRLHDFASAIGQTPIVQSVENPGYIFNWLLQATLKASLELVDRRVASPENIDLAWTRITGMERGPFGMMDLIGIDLIHQVLSNARWLGDYDGTQRLVDILQPYVDRGHLGVKTGQGFFEYHPDRESS